MPNLVVKETGILASKISAPCRAATLFFLAWFFVFFVFSAGHFFTVDSFTTAETTRNMLYGRIDIKPNLLTIQGRDGRYFTRHELLWSAILIPLDVVALLIERSLPAEIEKRIFPGGVQAVILPMATQIITALILVTLFHWFLKLDCSARASFIVVVSAGFSTMLLPYSRDLFRQNLSALLMLLSVAMLWNLRNGKEKLCALLAGIFLSLAILNHYSTIAFLPMFFVGLVLRLFSTSVSGKWHCTFPGFIIPVFLGLAGHFATIWFRFGDPFFNVGLEQNFSANPLRSVPSFFLSLERGFISYCPLWIFLFWGFSALWHKGEKWLTFMIVGLSASSVAFFGIYAGYTGGVNPGPRYLLPLMPLWFLPLGVLAEREKRKRQFWLGWGIISAFGVFINLYEALTDYTRKRSAGLMLTHLLFPSVDDGWGAWEIKDMAQGWFPGLISSRETQLPALIALILLIIVAMYLMFRTYQICKQKDSKHREL